VAKSSSLPQISIIFAEGHVDESGEVCVVSEKCYVCPCSVIAASIDCGRAEGQQGVAYRPGATLSRRDDLNDK
jgi:hypothetical protein